MGQQAVALLMLLNAAAQADDALAEATRLAFQQHADSTIYTSFPGLGELPAARVLAEVGDDRTRFADARGLKAYAGAAPVTRASGKSLTVMHRRVKNQRLASVGYIWAFSALTASRGARAHYDRRKAAGDRHVAAQRNLFNRMIGILHHCLATRTKYDEHTAFPTPQTHKTAASAAAA
jgi:transposase